MILFNIFALLFVSIILSVVIMLSENKNKALFGIISLTFLLLWLIFMIIHITQQLDFCKDPSKIKPRNVHKIEKYLLNDEKK